MKIYLSSVFESRNRIRPYRDQLWAMGHEITSSWLDEVAKPADMVQPTFYKKLAIKDMTEVRAADIFVLDTTEISPRGGKEVEFGLAIGSIQPKFVYVVGPVVNVFHALADETFKTWDEFIAYMKTIHGGTTV